jgi:hypothetical protein
MDWGVVQVVEPATKAWALSLNPSTAKKTETNKQKNPQRPRQPPGGGKWKTSYSYNVGVSKALIIASSFHFILLSLAILNARL